MQKVEGAKGRLDPAIEKPLALVQNGAAPMHERFRKVQETLGRPWLPAARRLSAIFYFRSSLQAAWFAIPEQVSSRYRFRDWELRKSAHR